MKTLTLVAHGESGVGKSWLGVTAPGPRLVLDAEGGSRFTPGTKSHWDPVREKPPTDPGPDETVVTIIRDFSTMQIVFQWLNSGQHPFRSVVMDSLTEIQKRCMDNIAGVNQPRQQDWGTLLREMETLVRQFRDLTLHPVHPLETVVFITTSMIDNAGKVRPNVQGQLRLTLPQFVDVVGYMYVAQTAEGGLQRVLMVQPYPGFIAKDRTNRLGMSVTDPDVSQMMEAIYGNS